MRTKWHKISIRAFSILGILCFITLLMGVFYLSPPTSSEEVVHFSVPTGSNSRAIAKRLVAEKLIRNEFAFRLIVRYRGVDKHLQAGDYQLRRGMSLKQILDELQKGHVALESWTVPEGLTVGAIAALWETAGYGTAEAFQKAAELPQWLQKYNLGGKHVEGYLFPNTYRFAKGTTAETVVEMMLDEFNRQWNETLAEETRRLGRTRHEVVTLASVIEMEAQSESERPLIGSVFHNRLARNWPLQADPTVLYALGNPERLLTRADLKVDSPYNTYLHKGLPPGPIGNPGIASLMAALRPEKTDYLYFVAIGNGKHHFSKTLAEHNRMVWKIKQDKAKKTGM